MQKLLNILLISFLLTGIITPALSAFAYSEQSPVAPAAVFDSYPAVLESEPLLEPYWECVYGAGGPDTCPPDTSDEMITIYSGVYQGGLGRYKIICTTPDCPTLAYYVYVKVDLRMTFYNVAEGKHNFIFNLTTRSDFSATQYDYSELVVCPQNSGTINCHYTVYLPIKKAQVSDWNGSNVTLQLDFYQESGNAFLGNNSIVTYDTELSFYAPSCDERVSIVENVLPETIIDETLEIPLGPDDPDYPDNQKIEITAGNMYRLETSDGPWRSGAESTTDLYSTELSLDEGATWIPLTDFLKETYEYVMCSEAKVPEPDLRIVMFIAPPGTVSLMIRVGPEHPLAPNWEDNWIPDDPMIYRVDLVGEFATLCSPFYTFDPDENLLNSGTIPANVSAGVDLTIMFPPNLVSAETGQPFTHPWIAIETGPAGWLEGGETEDRYAALGKWPALSAEITPHKSFTIGDDDNPESTEVDGTVQCVEAIPGGGFRVFLQVPNTSLLNLSVRDINSNYSDNTGALDYRIYLVERLRENSPCEATFEFSNDSWGSTVDARAENGKNIGAVVLPTAGAFNDFRVGEWYALDTQQGPWYGPGIGHGNNPSYRMQISLGTAAGPLTWHDLDDWADAYCVVELDTIGHVRVYFQVPNDLLGGPSGARAYYLRVADTDFSGNRGFMGYKVSRLIEISPDLDEGVCVGWGYDLSSAVADISIPSTAVNGAPADPTQLLPDQYYVLDVDGGPWYESQTSPPLYAIEISSDGGQTWYAPPQHPAVLCAEDYNNAGYKIYIKPQAGEMWRFRVMSISFGDNSGSQHITVREANPDGEIIGTCLDGAELFEIATYIVDAKREDGIVVPLVIGEVYAIEIAGGYWLDNALNPFGSQYYTLDMSVDNGTSWEFLHQHSRIDCFRYISRPLLLGGKARFQPGTGETIRLRVANGTPDTDGDWNNNGYGVTVKIYAVTNADDSNIDDEPVLTGLGDACMDLAIRPTSLLDLAGWVMYGFDSFRLYIAWCPRHNAAIQAIFSLFGQFEPFATLSAFATFYNTTKAELDSYNWTNPNSPSAIGGSDTATANAADSIFQQQGSGSPWETGHINLQGGGQNFSTDCNHALKPYLGQRLADPFCFSGNMMRAVGVSVWFQVLVDIIAVLSFVSYVAIRIVKPAFT